MNGRFVNLLAGGVLSSVVMLGSTVVPVDLTNTSSIPYLATVNGNANTTILCDDNLDIVQTGEDWYAYENTLQTIINTDGGSISNKVSSTLNLRFSVATSLYMEAGWLALQLSSTPSDASAIQAALWDVFDPGTASSGDSATWLSQAQMSSNYDGTLLLSKASSITFLSPDLSDAITNQVVKNGKTYNPQEFITITGTPEPSSYVLFGSGLVLLSIGTFRRRSSKKPE